MVAVAKGWWNRRGCRGEGPARRADQAEVTSPAEDWRPSPGLSGPRLYVTCVSRLVNPPSGTAFPQLPVCLRWLGGLEVLDLSANSLEGLPGWMGPPAAGGLGGAGASGTGATGTARTGTGTGAAGAAAAVGVCACCGGQPRRTSFDAQEGYSAGGGGGGPGPGGSGSARAASIGGGGGSGGGRGGGGAGCSHCGPGHSGLLGLRHLDVSQQFRVLLRDSPNPRVPTRLVRPRAEGT